MSKIGVDQDVSSCSDALQLVKELIDENRESSFFVADLSDIVKKIDLWRRELPAVKLFYAVKCNPEHPVLRLMASMGVGFDCASKKEINAALSAGAKPSDIIYAHPYKSVPFLRHARAAGVDLMTFDCHSELYKIKANHPNARLVLRFRVSKVKAGFPLNNKFGCPPKECYNLMKIAKSLDLNVVGTCFHVGSLCQEPEAYARAICTARYVFDIAEELGFHFTMLDIGGGYPGHTGSQPTFLKMCSQIRDALEEFFPDRDNLHIVAEPGCYLLCSAFTLCAQIIGKKTTFASDDEEEENCTPAIQVMYYLNESVYLSFPEGIDLYNVRRVPLLNDDMRDRRRFLVSKLWGCTCCSSDCIVKKCMLPEMELGEHIAFQNMGAYTLNFATDFNGFPKPQVYYTYSVSKGLDNSEYHGNSFYTSTLAKEQLSVDDEGSHSEEEENCYYHVLSKGGI